MDMDALQSMISTLGFPIVACIYVAWSSQKQADNHRAEMSKMTEAVNELKIAITRLVEKIDE